MPEITQAKVRHRKAFDLNIRKFHEYIRIFRNVLTNGYAFAKIER